MLSWARSYRAAMVAHPRGRYETRVAAPWSSASSADKLRALRAQAAALKAHDDVVDWEAALHRTSVSSLFDADILGYFQNQPDAAAPEVLGNVAWAPGPRGPDGQLKTNIWIWSLAMNAGSKNKDAAWLFLQWATGQDFLTTGATKYNMVNPVRAKIWDNPDFQKRMAEQKDYLKTFQEISSNDMKIQFTPQPLFFETTTEWAQALQDIYAGADAQERLDKLVESLTQQLKDAGIYQE